jgi:hypothetical protein
MTATLFLNDEGGISIYNTWGTPWGQAGFRFSIEIAEICSYYLIYECGTIEVSGDLGYRQEELLF